MGLFDNLFGNRKQTLNKFNQAFFWGAKYTTNDDTDLKKYVDLAYNINPDVYTIVSQKSNKLISIPYSLKKIEDEQSLVSDQLNSMAEGMKVLLRERINEYNISSGLSEPVQAKECPHWTSVDKDCGLNRGECKYPNCLV